MTERREPTLSGPVADSAASAQGDPTLTSSSSNATASEVSASNADRSTASLSSFASNKKRPAPVSQRVIEVKSPLAPLALVAAVIALAFCGLVFWQMTEHDQTNKALLTELNGAKQRIAELERKLTATGDESSQSLAGLGASIKSLNADLSEANSEIRKLWGVSHDRNRKAIEQNKNSIARANKSIANTKKAQQKDHQALQAALANLQGELAVLGEVQESQQSALAQRRLSAADVEAFKTEINRRVASNEEAIKAIDAFRLQVNRQLIQMQGAPAP